MIIWIFEIVLYFRGFVGVFELVVIREEIFVGEERESESKVESGEEREWGGSRWLLNDGGLNLRLLFLCLNWIMEFFVWMGDCCVVLYGFYICF